MQKATTITACVWLKIGAEKSISMPADPPAYSHCPPPTHPIRVIERGIAARLPSLPSPTSPYCLLGIGIVIGAIIAKLLGL